MERAKELGYLVLTNKQYQTTRFVRSLIRGLTAALRNLPTLDIVLKEELNVLENTGRLDKVSKIKKSLREIKEAKNLLFVIGLMQVLEVNAEVKSL